MSPMAAHDFHARIGGVHGGAAAGPIARPARRPAHDAFASTRWRLGQRPTGARREEEGRSDISRGLPGPGSGLVVRQGAYITCQECRLPAWRTERGRSRSHQDFEAANASNDRTRGRIVAMVHDLTLAATDTVPQGRCRRCTRWATARHRRPPNASSAARSSGWVAAWSATGTPAAIASQAWRMLAAPAAGPMGWPKTPRPGTNPKSVVPTLR
jgi:hypothetical protein